MRPTPAAVALALGSLLLFGGLYAGCSWLGDGLPKHHLYLAWECQIPLVPWAALVYLSISLMLIPLLRTFPTFPRLWPVALTLALQQGVAALCFVLLPLEGGYPSQPVPPGWSGWLWQLSNQLALRHNYFPSLHVALAWTAVLVISRERGQMQWGLLAWAAAIALSTLLVHQHHLIDIAGGVLLAWASVALVFDRWSKP